MKITNVTKQIGDAITRNSPAILTGMAVSGVVGTAVMAVQATPKALDLINIAMEEKNRQYRLDLSEEDGYNMYDSIPHQHLDKKEIILASYKCYIPAAIMGVATVVCIIGANTINTRRNAALASLYSLTETTLKEYKEQVVKTVGKTKAEKIKADTAQAIVDSNPLPKNTIVISDGDQLCFDSLSGRYFKSSVTKLQQIQNKFNAKLLDCCWMDLNELYSMMENERLTPIVIGDSLGWNNNKLLEFDFSTIMSEDNTPCIYVDYAVRPSADFRKF